mmetsp:Transcript_32224/g.68795  ORF Transcript_32224/g.68795 Transcript_32224/m.68795 type:complete len:352 (+) Transcript_32224:97-1152(+)
MVRLTAILSATLVGLSAAVTKEKLAEFAFSVGGLDFPNRKLAEELSAAYANKINAARIPLTRLKALNDAMYSSTNGMDMSKQAMAEQIFPVATDGVDPAALATLYKGLYSMSGCNMDKTQAQSAALELAGIPVDPAPLKKIWDTLYSMSGANLNKQEAHRWVVDVMAAGADGDVFESDWKANWRVTSNKGEALKKTIASAVAAGAAGLQARYAKDGKLYSPAQFQSYYGDMWLVEWLQAPLEKRVANDGKEYTAREFQAFYSQDVARYWNQAQEAPQRRMAEDGQTYTLQEFISYYKNNWQTKFQKASIVADECAGLNHEGCDKKASVCQWKWTGDWTDSCVLKSSMAFMV